MTQRIKRLIKFLTHDVWAIDSRQGRLLDILINEIKIFIITFKNYGRHKIAVRSAALTYYTIISIVPITAMILGLSKGFGLDDEAINFLKNAFNNSDVVVSYVSQFANAFLQNSNLGIFAGISVLVLMWSVFMVFFNIEESFNFIWEIKKMRPIHRRLNDYISIIIILPILYALSTSVKSFIEGELEKFVSHSVVTIFLYKITLLLFYLLTVWLIFAVVYAVLPNTRVKFKAAFHAAIFAGGGYILFKYIYIFFQSSVSNYNIIYGSFAALPLLLLWLNICWQIILFGAELSFAYQNMARYEYERTSETFSYNLRMKLMVLVVRSIVVNFINNSKPLSAEQIADKTNMPVAAVRDIIYYLVDAKIVYAIENDLLTQKSSFYTMGVDVSTLTVGMLLDIIQNKGTSRIKNVENFDVVYNLKDKHDTLIKDLVVESRETEAITVTEKQSL